MKVSITTVSHVISKTRHVNQETRAAVVKAMEELEYRRRTTMQPNRIQYIGLICAASTIGYELVSVLDDLDTDVQRRMRVVSCDDNRWFDYLKFPISVISQPTAVENLLQLIEQKHSPPAVKRELFFDVNLIDRLD